MDKKSYVQGHVKSASNGLIQGAVASNQSVDRDGDRILAGGWSLDTFKKQPRLLWSHDARQLPIGKVTNINIMGDSLVFDAEFASEKANPFAQHVKAAMEEGMLNTFSVGFIPLEHNDKGEISKAELYEISVVNIPANPEAMTHSLKFKEFQAEVKTIEAVIKEEKKIEPVKHIITKKQLDSFKNAIGALDLATSTLNDVIKSSEVVTKKGAKDLVKSSVAKNVVVKAKGPSNVLKAMRIIDRATEHVIYELKKSEYKHGKK